MKNIKVVILIILIVITILFIFSNSVKRQTESNEQSASVTEKILRIFKLEDRVDIDNFHSFIRKAAHFTEFFILGLEAFLLKFELDKKYFSKLTIAPFGLTLTIAMSDEFIQSFSDRASSFLDVLLDFTGAVFGIFSAMLLIVLAKKISLRFFKKVA